MRSPKGKLSCRSAITPLKKLEPTTIQPPYESSIIKSYYETILSTIITNKSNKCNTSVNLLVDIEKGGNNINRD